MGLFITTILFILHCYFLGFSVSKLTKINLEEEHLLIKIAVIFLVGFAVLNIIPFLLGLVGIPIHIMAITIFSLVLFAITLIVLNQRNELKNCLIKVEELKTKISAKNWRKPVYAIGIIMLILVSTVISFTGTFKTTHFEDTDPWVYACLSDYVATEKTYFVEKGVDCGAKNVYLKPLPRRLTVLFGIYAQTNDSIQLNMKLMFNYFLLLGIIGFVLLFYFFFNQDLRKVFFATLFIVSTPAFLGRFIFENNLGLFLLPIALIPLIKIMQGDVKWWVLGGITLGAQVISHPPTSIFSVLFIIIAILFCGFEERKKIFSHKWKQTKAIKLFFVGLIALGILLIYMIQPFIMYPGESLTVEQKEIHFGPYSASEAGEYMGWIKQYNPAYSLTTLAKAERSSKMDQATGFGVILFILMLLSLLLVIYKSAREKNMLQRVVLVNFLITGILLVIGWKSGLALFTSRFWPVVAFYGAIIFAIGIGVGFDNIKSAAIRMLLVVIIILAVYFTSFVQDASIQTSPWPQHQYNPQYDEPGYNFVFSNVLPGTKVFPVCKNGLFLLGLDKQYEYKNNAHTEYLKTLKNQSSQEIFDYVQNIDYPLVVLDTSCIQSIGINKTSEVLGLMSGANYQVLFKTDAFFLLKKPGIK